LFTHTEPKGRILKASGPVAGYFAGRETIGDGELHRVVAELQRVYFRAPTMYEATRKGPRQMEKVRRRAMASE
jgi:hypothetical protein